MREYREYGAKSKNGGSIRDASSWAAQCPSIASAGLRRNKSYPTLSTNSIDDMQIQAHCTLINDRPISSTLARVAAPVSPYSNLFVPQHSEPSPSSARPRFNSSSIQTESSDRFSSFDSDLAHLQFGGQFGMDRSHGTPPPSPQLKAHQSSPILDNTPVRRVASLDFGGDARQVGDDDWYKSEGSVNSIALDSKG